MGTWRLWENLWWVLPQGRLALVSSWTWIDSDLILLVHLHGATQSKVAPWASVHLLVRKFTLTCIHGAILVHIQIVLCEEVSLVRTLVWIDHALETWEWTPGPACCCGHGSLSSSHGGCLAIAGGRTALGAFLHSGFHLLERAFGKIFLWLDSIEELSLAQSGISIQIQSPNNGNQESITRIDAALDKESLQIGCVDESEVAIVNVGVQRFQIVIVLSGQVLLQHLRLPCESQFFL